MHALWIRIEAHEIDSIRIARFAEALGVDVVRALGHFVALAGAVAEHASDGSIGVVPDTLLERWGRWIGRRGRFAKAVREVLQDGDGSLASWRDSMGKLIEKREKDAARKRDGKGSETHAESAEFPRSECEESAENPRSERGVSDATERTERTERTVKQYRARRAPAGAAVSRPTKLRDA